MPHRANYCVRLTHDSNPQWTVASDHAMHQEAVPTAKLQRQSIRGEKRCDSRRNEVRGSRIVELALCRQGVRGQQKRTKRDKAKCMGKAGYQTTQFIRCSKCPQARFGKRRTISAQSEVQYSIESTFCIFTQSRPGSPCPASAATRKWLKWSSGSSAHCK
jgi:hypothetical protein